MTVNIKEILFWVFLVISIVLLVWSVFGNSPSEFIALVAIILMVVLKVWSIGDKQIVTDSKVDNIDKNIKDSFNKMKDDINLIKKRLGI